METFTINPGDSAKVFPNVPIAWSWILRPLLAEASDVLGVGDAEAQAAEKEFWLKQGIGATAHHMMGHNLALQWGRNTDPVMQAMCGGYANWQHGIPGTNGVARGLYMGMSVDFHNPMPMFGFGEIRHRLDGIFGSKTNALIRYCADLFGKDGTHYQTVQIMSRVAGVVSEGMELPKAPRRQFEMPNRDSDYTEIHVLAGKNTVYRWATAAEDPNLRHIDEADPRAHGPCAISILVHAALRRFANSDVTRLKRISVPGFPNPFYQEDTLTVNLWEHEGRIVGRLFRDRGEEKERLVLDMVEVEIAA